LTLGVLCPFCPRNVLLSGNGQDKAKKAVRDHRARHHADVPEGDKLAFVRGLRPWADAVGLGR